MKIRMFEARPITNNAPALDRLIWITDIGNRLTDYKNRFDKNPAENKDAQKWPFPKNFDVKSAGNYDPNTVTFCGVVISKNQLGNIMYGIMAHDLQVETEARAYGQGRFKVRGVGKAPDPNWLVPDHGPYRAAAFELGLKYAEKTAWDKSDVKLMEGYVKRAFRAPYVKDEVTYDGANVRARITDDLTMGGLSYTPSTVKYMGPPTDLDNHKAWGIASDGNIKK